MASSSGALGLHRTRTCRGGPLGATCILPGRDRGPCAFVPDPHVCSLQHLRPLSPLLRSLPAGLGDAQGTRAERVACAGRGRLRDCCDPLAAAPRSSSRCTCGPGSRKLLPATLPAPRTPRTRPFSDPCFPSPSRAQASASPLLGARRDSTPSWEENEPAREVTSPYGGAAGARRCETEIEPRGGLPGRTPGLPPRWVTLSERLGLLICELVALAVLSPEGS